MKRKRLFFAFLALLFACKKDMPPERPASPIGVGTSGGVFVLNEGNFLFGNAKIGYYAKNDNSTIIDLYGETNGFGVGDVLQSMYVHNGKAYLVVNNSGKIDVCDPVSLKLTASISGFTSPRYFLPVSNNKAYVTDLYANKIWIVNLATQSITGSIALNGWCENMTSLFGEVYVANFETGKLYTIDASTDAITDSIALTKGVSDIAQDYNGYLWALCGGDAVTATPPYVYKIDPGTKTIVASLALSGSAGRLCTNATHDTLYYLNNGVMRFAANTPTINPTLLIAQGSYNFYGLGIDPHTGNVYVSDAIDYIQAGKILIYKANGAYVNQFDASVIPADFWFQ